MKKIGLKNLVALSGGVDSTVLLHQLVMLREHNPNILLRAIHINHQLSPNADKWEKHCKHVCEQFNIEFLSEKVNADPEVGESPEDAARKSRYSVFAKIIDEGECLLTAHNADDQAETVLLQLLRGAGPKGLAAMPEKKTFFKEFHVRPLLNLTRNEIIEYAKKQNLSWVDDESNKNNNFDRNYLRNKVMPILKKRGPQLTKTFSRSAENCAEAKYLLEELAEEDFNTCKDSDEMIVIDKLNKMTLSRKKNLLRYYLKENFSERISAKKLDQLMTSFLTADEDKNPVLELENHEVHRFKNNLRVVKKLPNLNADLIIPWDLKNHLTLPADLGALDPRNFDIKSDQAVTIRFRQGGEKCKPQGRNETHALKKLFQEWEVPPWQRDRVPLIYVGEQIAYVVGYCQCECS